MIKIYVEDNEDNIHADPETEEKGFEIVIANDGREVNKASRKRT